MKKNVVNTQSVSNLDSLSSSDVILVVVPHDNLRNEPSVELRNEGIVARSMPMTLHSKALDIRKFSNRKYDIERSVASSQPDVEVFKDKDITKRTLVVQMLVKDPRMVDGQKRGRTRSLVTNWERKERLPRHHEGHDSDNFPGTVHNRNKCQ